MKKIIITTSVFGIIAVVVISIILVMGNRLVDRENEIEFLEKENSELRKENFYKFGQIYELEKYNEFQQALSKVGSIPYSETNNCYEHSKLLQEELSKRYIKSSIFVSQNREHAWLGVWINANTGHFETKDYQVYEVRDDNLEVICK